MRMPRTSVRRLMIAIALGAIASASAKLLIVGDGGYNVQFVNGLGKPIQNVRLVSGGVTLTADELLPGSELLGRLWAKRLAHVRRSVPIYP